MRIDVEKSIKTIKSYTVLYDINCKEYKDLGIKENISKEVAKNLMIRVKMCLVFVRSLKCS